jgi:hypothetical protein
MGRERKVTREMARDIYHSFEALRISGYKNQDAFKIIQSDVFDTLSVKLGLGTVKDYAYQTFDKRIECHKKSEKNREAQRRYRQISKPRNEKFSLAIDVFTSLDVELTPRQVWEKVGGRFCNISKSLFEYQKVGLLERVEKGNTFLYKLNPHSPFRVMVDGYFEKKEKEIFGGT